MTPTPKEAINLAKCALLDRVASLATGRNLKAIRRILDAIDVLESLLPNDTACDVLPEAGESMLTRHDHKRIVRERVQAVTDRAVFHVRIEFASNPLATIVVNRIQAEEDPDGEKAFAAAIEDAVETEARRCEKVVLQNMPNSGARIDVLRHMQRTRCD